MNYANIVSAKKTPQTQAIPGREKEMKKNNAGGVVFTLSPFDHLMRFLILGTEGGTYYASERNHTLQAFDGLKTCIDLDARKTVDLAVNVSVQGRAAKNDAALFTIACVMAFAKKPEDKHYARTQLNQVARTGTHILQFADFIDNLKGWGTGTRKAFKSWFTDKTAEQIAYQYVKYGQRNGWSMRDLLRKSHPIGNEEQNVVFQYIAKNGEGFENTAVQDILFAAEEAKTCSASEVIKLIKEYNLPREALGTQHLNNPKVWEALLPEMGLTAMIRNLGKMTSIGLIKPLSTEAKFIAKKLTDREALKRARIHPMALMFALKTYKSGKGLKGSLSWNKVDMICDALEDAFEKSFDIIEPSGKNILLALDVSGSMTTNHIPGTGISAREVSAVMALVTAKAEKNYHFMAFSGGFIPLDITAKDSFFSVQKKMSGMRFDSTDCSLPMRYAESQKLDVDVFQVYTDNETYGGPIQPSQALSKYRKSLGKPQSKLAVVGITSTKFTIADPKDPYMLDFVGFDTNAPAAMAEFARM